MLPEIVLTLHCLKKIVLNSDLKNFANSRPSASNFKSFSRSLEQFLVTKYHTCIRFGPKRGISDFGYLAIDQLSAWL
jgi:hypothetical protein